MRYCTSLNLIGSLTIITWKIYLFIYCALLNSVQKFIEIQGWLLLTFFICLQNQVLLIPLSYRCLKNVIHQIDSKNEWLPLSGLILKPGPRPWTRTQKNLDPEKPGPRKTWTLKNLDPEKLGPWKTWTLKVKGFVTDIFQWNLQNFYFKNTLL